MKIRSTRLAFSCFPSSSFGPVLNRLNGLSQFKCFSLCPLCSVVTIHMTSIVIEFRSNCPDG